LWLQQYNPKDGGGDNNVSDSSCDKTLRFEKRGFASRRFITGLSYRIKFDLKTRHDGFVMMIGEPATLEKPRSPFMSIWVMQGHFMVACNGSVNMVHMKSANIVADNEWHTYEVIRDKRDMVVKIDDFLEMSTITSAFVDDVIPEDLLYIGGRPNEEMANGIIGITACIRNIELNNEKGLPLNITGIVGDKCHDKSHSPKKYNDAAARIVDHRTRPFKINRESLTSDRNPTAVDI
jgi:hypothetical protein